MNSSPAKYLEHKQWVVLFSPPQSAAPMPKKRHWFNFQKNKGEEKYNYTKMKNSFVKINALYKPNVYLEKYTENKSIPRGIHEANKPLNL